MFRPTVPVLSLVVVLSIALAAPAFAKTDIEFILDASGSMRAAMAGSTQMDVAKQTIKSTVGTIPPETHVALRVYGHRVEQSDKAGSCVDTELMVPFGPLNVAAISSRVDSIQPKGYTPIAYSLQQVANDFGVDREAEKVIILVSDGEETCGGDPVQAVKDLIAKGFKVKVNAVGFNVDPKTQAQLQAIAAAGGGQYYDARDPAGLASSLKEVTQKALLVEKTTAVYGQEVKGGDSYETAVPLSAGIEYRLNHHQRQNQFDYFYVDLKGGQELIATLNTVQKGVTIQDQRVDEHVNAYAGMQLHDGARNKLAAAEIIGTANDTKVLKAYAPAAGRYYLLIGSTYADQHKDHPFKIEIRDHYDAGTGGDSPDNPDGAVALEKGKDYNENYFTAQRDEVDFYKVSTAKGETITVKALPENLKAALEITLYDELRVQLAKAHSPNEGAGVQVTGTAAGGTTFIKVVLYFTGEVDTKYSLKVEGVAPAAAPAAPPPPPPKASEGGSPSAASDQRRVPTDGGDGGRAASLQGRPPAQAAGIRWMSWPAFKGLTIAFGVGALTGLIGGAVLRRVFSKKNKQNT